MRRRQQFLGGYVPGTSWLHRTPALVKLAAVCAVGICAVAVRAPWLSLGLAVAAVLAGLSAGLPLRRILEPAARLWPLLLLLLGLNAWLTGPEQAARTLSTIIVCVLTAGLLMLTASVAQLLAAFEVLAQPVRLVGIGPERAGLAAALTVRSIPVLADLFADAGDAARARGLERSLRARTVPVALRAVKYADDTGRALAARGLGD
ncbi:energy-coupling factor transporter transmembrane protein EcfT [Brevibacterium sp. BRM-1]|uniref:energy-coupling factor transporter transmembrane component T family protein n=1 Tax=Brevibacterium sp. BRM-1 TaxID=2999062 RepID=UPI002282F7EF|nr:energy-coupling factor transporter transmembrane protein EcfT [Brevibacterium sp. BRM-1]WAL40150.1 energy-coupling factor transporter transmembrane protein EcfT [Brevibacterium sp. BRM-1]